ncbi:3-dehydroquinate synthase [Candidatus Magnetoovum chiemensis]|nr:3-dehydroquinate synthase [Candidatus Magnetoovum chiemensis]
MENMLKVELGQRSYEIVIAKDIIQDIAKKLREFTFTRNAALISNDTIFNLYGESVLHSMKEQGFNVTEILIKDGEEYKDLGSLDFILTKMLHHGLDRKSVAVALGGGVIGDIAGFAASVYMRGICFIQIPTTLLAQVDSSVGGKTGVNHRLGKNMIGSFYQPRLVWIDINTLKTLSRRQFLSGMAEVIKYGIIWDNGFFSYLKDNYSKIISLEDSSIINIIRKSCEIKAAVVSEDERESGLRAILNFGHTVGHAIETLSDYRRFLHGEAVAIGMCIEAKLAKMLSLIDRETFLNIQEIAALYHLPTNIPLDLNTDDMYKAMIKDKKNFDGKMRFVLPSAIGSVKVVDNIDKQTIMECLKGA